jgi:hypothetical protein
LKSADQNAAFESQGPGCHIEGMTDRPKRPRDANQMAKFVVDKATGLLPADKEVAEARTPESELGRIGGLKGGKARAAALSRCC